MDFQLSEEQRMIKEVACETVARQSLLPARAPGRGASAPSAAAQGGHAEDLRFLEIAGVAASRLGDPQILRD